MYEVMFALPCLCAGVCGIVYMNGSDRVGELMFAVVLALMLVLVFVLMFA